MQAEQRRIAEEQRRIAEEQKRIAEEKRRKEQEAIANALALEIAKKQNEKLTFWKNYANGTIVKFGNYYYENEESKQPLEWYILSGDFEEKTVQLITKDVIDYQEYFGEYETNSSKHHWYDSFICNWLNTTFYNTAFNEVEKNKIVPVHVNVEHARYNASAYNVFLLDKNYYSNCKCNNFSIAKATSYVKSQIPNTKKQLELETAHALTYETMKEYKKDNDEKRDVLNEEITLTE